MAEKKTEKMAEKMAEKMSEKMVEKMAEKMAEDMLAPQTQTGLSSLLGGFGNRYDVLLLGKTGMGKSTLGNKLISYKPKDNQSVVEDGPKSTATCEDQPCLASKNDSKSLSQARFKTSDDAVLNNLQSREGNFRLRLRSTTNVCELINNSTTGVGVLDTPGFSNKSQARFKTADDVVLQSREENFQLRQRSTTNVCELINNSMTGVRVLDTPGFSNTSHRSSASPYEGNLQIFRWIVLEQRNRDKNLKIRRVLYFLPERGVPEKADRGTQDELNLIHHFFGPDIFNCMVIIATNRKDKRYQRLGFTEDDALEAQTLFKLSYKLATGEELHKCPPVVYIPVNYSEEEVVSAIKKAEVIEDKIFVPQFQDDVCSRCTIKVVRNFKNEGICVADDEHSAYETTWCHPVFVPKYTVGEKVQGGLVHIATLGTALLYEAITKKETWPGFTNSDEICPSCKHSPGLKGCLQVKEKFLLPDGSEITVEHTNEL